MSVVTIKPIVLREGVSPLPIYRFTDDDTITMDNRVTGPSDLSAPTSLALASTTVLNIKPPTSLTLTES